MTAADRVKAKEQALLWAVASVRSALASDPELGLWGAIGKATQEAAELIEGLGEVVSTIACVPQPGSTGVDSLEAFFGGFNRGRIGSTLDRIKADIDVINAMCADLGDQADDALLDAMDELWAKRIAATTVFMDDCSEREQRREAAAQLLNETLGQGSVDQQQQEEG